MMAAAACLYTRGGQMFCAAIPPRDKGESWQASKRAQTTGACRPTQPTKAVSREKRTHRHSPFRSKNLFSGCNNLLKWLSLSLPPQPPPLSTRVARFSAHLPTYFSSSIVRARGGPKSLLEEMFVCKREQASPLLHNSEDGGGGEGRFRAQLSMKTTHLFPPQCSTGQKTCFTLPQVRFFRGILSRKGPLHQVKRIPSP